MPPTNMLPMHHNSCLVGDSGEESSKPSVSVSMSTASKASSMARVIASLFGSSKFFKRLSSKTEATVVAPSTSRPKKIVLDVSVPEARTQQRRKN